MKPLAVEEVARDVIRLQIPINFHDPADINLYLLRTREGDVLVDAGMPGSEAAVEQALHDAGSSPTTLRMLVITHEHPDHFGLAGCAEAPVHLHPLTWELIRLFRKRDETRIETMLERFWLNAADIPAYHHFQSFMDLIRWPETVNTVQDGQMLPGGWQVLWTPGHAPGHICLYRRDDQTLVGGDLLLPGHTPHVGMDPFNDDPVGAYLASLNRVAEMPIQLVLPAHGEPFTDPASCITGLKEHHRRRLVRTAQLVETPTQTRAVADQLFPYARGPIEEMMATLETAAHLIHLEQLQLVKRVEPRRWVSVASKAGIDDPTDR